MKRTLTSLVLLLTALVLLTSALTLPAAATETAPYGTSGSAMIYCATADTLLWSKNDQQPVYPSGTVKIMTAVLALEHYEGRMKDTITVTADHIRRATGNSIDLQVGETLTVEELIGALIVGGANDAAQTLALDIAGSVDEFVRRMNEKARELGMTGTHYTNPSGLYDGAMVTTAADVLTIARYAARINAYMDLAGLSIYRIEGSERCRARTIQNRNLMLTTYNDRQYYFGLATGMNFGSTPEGGDNLVVSASKNGLTYIAVVLRGVREERIVTPAVDTLNDDGTITHKDAVTETVICAYEEARDLLEWAMRNYAYRTVLDASEMICELPVTLGTSVDHVTLLPRTSVELYLPLDLDLTGAISMRYTLEEESLAAPVMSGTKVGTVYIGYQGEVVSTTDLVTKNNVERSEWLYLLAQLRDATKTTPFRIGAIAAILAVIAYVLGVAMWRQKRKDAAKRQYYRNNRVLR